MSEILLLIDGNSLMYRAFHALPLLSVGDVYTNALQGFLSMMLKAFSEEGPTYCAVAFDMAGPTFRHEEYEEYKAGRKPMPEELVTQFPLIKEILEKMGIGVYGIPGYEADDLLGTFARQGEEEGLSPLLLTGDRDALQLVNGKTKLLFTKKGISETVRFDPESMYEYFGVRPDQVTDWKGLMGDSSDNIPGIPGVGEKTAVKLLKEYDTLEAVLAHGDDIPGKLGERIRDYKEQAIFSKKLATINCHAPATLFLEGCRLSRLEGGIPILRQYKLSQIEKRLAQLLQSGALPAQAALEGAAEPVVAEPLPVIAFAPWQPLNTVAEITALAAELASSSLEVALHLGEGLSLAAGDGRRWQVNLHYDMLTPGLDTLEVLAALTPLIQAKELVVHGGKTLLHQLQKAALPVPEAFAWDTMIGAYLLNPQERSYALTHFTADGSEDAAALLALYQSQRAAVRDQGMEALMLEMELPLIHVLYAMEEEGFTVDRQVLSHLGEGYVKEIDSLREKVYALTGVPDFNLNSPQQLGTVLFDTLGLPAGKKSQKGYSTSADILEGLVEHHESIAYILKYRQLVKLNGTYIDGLLRLVGKDGRIHTTFEQTGTATGRISSSEPNLQNIPVRTDIGREIRRAFIPREGWVLVDADYSQIELRVLAHLSGDPAMVEAFRLGQDIHTRTAAEVYGVAMDKVTPSMRASAKAVNFGIVYGISDFGLARNTGISRREAADFIKRYFDRYPGVRRFMDESVANGKLMGYAETLFGRRRHLPELRSSNANVRNFGERVAMNTPIQGTAADIIKLAMVRVYKELRESTMAARLTLQVHDELIIECPPEEVEAAKALLKTSMEGVISLSVPLVADVNSGKSWYETK